MEMFFNMVEYNILRLSNENILQHEQIFRWLWLCMDWCGALISRKLTKNLLKKEKKKTYEHQHVDHSSHGFETFWEKQC